MAKMTEAELRSTLWQRAQRASAEWDTALKDARRKAMNYYRGEKFGNEQEGMSQIVTRDVAEAIDGVMPSIMEIFSSGDQTVNFEPNGPEDEDQAAQATDYVNHIWNQQNDGFHNFHDWFKDALLHRLGVVKIWWDDSAQAVRETYRDLTDEEWAAIEADTEVEVIEHTEAPTIGLDGRPALSHDAVVVKTSAGPQGGRIRVVPVPPEEFICTPGLARLDDPPIVGHRCRKTISDLLLMGYDEKKVKKLAAGPEDYTGERIERHDAESALSAGEDDEAVNDPSMREVWLYELWARIDYDGDGIAELRKVCVAGEGQVVLANEEDDGHPFAAVSPILMPHKLFGMSMADQVFDLQLIKSTLMRQMLDNMYRVNMPQREVVDGQVNLDDLMSQRVGGIVRSKALGSVREMAIPFTAGAAFPIVEYLDQIRDTRTGSARFSTGPGADSLNPYTRTATGANIADDRAKQRVMLIARVFAETGVKRAFRRILELVSKHQQAPKIIRLRNQWVPIDPRGWNTRMDMTVQVGLGTGSKDQQIAAMTNLLTLDQQIIAFQGGADGPLVTLSNVYKKLEKLVQASGLKSVEPYYSDPTAPPDPNAPPKQPKPDPKMLEIQGKLEIEKSRLGMEQQKGQAQLELDRQRMYGELAVKREGLGLDAQLEREKAVMKAHTDMGLAPSGAPNQVADVMAQAQMISDGLMQLGQMMAQGFGAQAEGQQRLEAALIDLAKLVGAERQITVFKSADGRWDAHSKPVMQ